MSHWKDLSKMLVIACSKTITYVYSVFAYRCSFSRWTGSRIPCLQIICLLYIKITAPFWSHLVPISFLKSLGYWFYEKSPHFRLLFIYIAYICHPRWQKMHLYVKRTVCNSANILSGQNYRPKMQTSYHVKLLKYTCVRAYIFKTNLDVYELIYLNFILKMCGI